MTNGKSDELGPSSEKFFDLITRVQGKRLNDQRVDPSNDEGPTNEEGISDVINCVRLLMTSSCSESAEDESYDPDVDVFSIETSR